MVNEDKEQRWQEMCTRVEHMTDRLGKGIDPGIVDTVVVLNLLDIPTTMSCEGHLDHGTAAPWIHVGDPGIREHEDKVHRLSQHASEQERQQGKITPEIMQLFEEVRQARRDVKRMHLAIWQKLVHSLNAFYEGRFVPYDVRLVIQPLGIGQSRLESQGADFQEVAPGDVRTLKLAEYQEEMRLLTAFLKQQYFQE